MRNGFTSDLLRRVRKPAAIVGCGLLAAVVGAVVMYAAERMILQKNEPGSVSAETDEHVDENEDEEGHAAGGHITLPKAQWKSADLQMEQVRLAPMEDFKWVTGKLVLNEDRTAEIYPLVEGRVHNVRAAFGETVEQGQVLALIDSREIGEAKLELLQDRLAADIARVNHEWASKVNANTQQLIDALERGRPTFRRIHSAILSPLSCDSRSLLPAGGAISASACTVRKSTTHAVGRRDCCCRQPSAGRQRRSGTTNCRSTQHSNSDRS